MHVRMVNVGFCVQRTTLKCIRVSPASVNVSVYFCYPKKTTKNLLPSLTSHYNVDTCANETHVQRDLGRTQCHELVTN